MYRVEVAFLGADPRVAQRESLPSVAETEALLARLAAMDTRSRRGPWVERTLALIEAWPERRAPELAELESRETLDFKADVRKLKELGLTESLPRRLPPIASWHPHPQGPARAILTFLGQKRRAMADVCGPELGGFQFLRAAWMVCQTRSAVQGMSM